MTDRTRADAGLLALRVALGTIFFLHGWEKLFGGGLSFVSQMLEIVGWAFPAWLLFAVALVELFGGLALIVGYGARLAAGILAVEMVLVVILFHARQGFFIDTVPSAPLAYGFEFHVALVGGLICTGLAGPGGLRLSPGHRSDGDTAEDSSGE